MLIIIVHNVTLLFWTVFCRYVKLNLSDQHDAYIVMLILTEFIVIYNCCYGLPSSRQMITVWISLSVLFVNTLRVSIHLLLNCHDKKAAKTNLDVVVHTCIVEFMQLILHFIYTYSMIFKLEHNLLHLIMVAVDYHTHTCI